MKRRDIIKQLESAGYSKCRDDGDHTVYAKENAAHAGLSGHLQKGQRFFTSCGVITGKDGLWLRKQYLILAKNNSTPVPFSQRSAFR